MVLRMELGERSYDITVERGSLTKALELFDLKRKVCIVTDEGVPRAYAETLAAQCETAVICTVPQGEDNKSLASMEKICGAMLQNNFSRRDCVVAVGGGMVGDLAGYAAASFMRGIDFYNIPTTLLSQVDSSIGGKTGVNFGGVKNIVGAFWQPKGVLIDTETLETLSPRLRAEGMAEAIKMLFAFDAATFDAVESDPWAHLEEILVASLRLKKGIVERDERESGERKLLNFGHTIGHGVEYAANGALYHGECVAIGMLPMCGEGVRARLKAVLEHLGLPVETALSKETIAQAMRHDKKSNAKGFSAVFVDEIGKAYSREVSFAQMNEILEGAWRK